MTQKEDNYDGSDDWEEGDWAYYLEYEGKRLVSDGKKNVV